MLLHESNELNSLVLRNSRDFFIKDFIKQLGEAYDDDGNEASLFMVVLLFAAFKS